MKILTKYPTPHKAPGRRKIWKLKNASVGKSLINCSRRNNSRIEKWGK